MPAPLRLAVVVSAIIASVELRAALPQTVFRGGVDLVHVTATVTDDDGSFVRDLRRDDFVVYDNGQPQEILTFSSERVPVSLGVLLDVSLSMTESKLAAARIAIRRFGFELLGREDELFLAEFGGEWRMLQSWTQNRETFGRALDRARGQFGTALYDAVVRALPLAGGGVHPKKALLILSDGEDTRSRTPIKRAQEEIRSSEVLVYALGIEDAGRVDASALRKLTDETGGRTEIVRGFRNLEDATTRLANELNQQYQIGYAAPVHEDGKWRTIRIEVRKRGVRVRARSGYVAS
jgi:Ca-activated chloride channel family protein